MNPALNCQAKDIIALARMTSIHGNVYAITCMQHIFPIYP